MDERTLAAYDADTTGFAAKWNAQPPADDVHALVREYFAPGQPTADVGCGGGRETLWLACNGYAVTGYDASAGLIDEARRRFPGIRFEQAALPGLSGIPAGSFANVFCETVIMHLQAPVVGRAVSRLLELLRPAGTLYLSWRATSGADRRDNIGRLFSAFDDTVVTGALADAAILYQADTVSTPSANDVRRLIVRKPG